MSIQCRAASTDSLEMFGSTMCARVAVQSRAVSTNRHTERTCGVQTKRSWSNEKHRVDDAQPENGTTSHPQSIGSRQSGRPHDQGHDPRATDQVRTCSELARINLHRLGPTCTVTRVRPITRTFTVLKNTVSSFQDHRLTANLRTTIETGSTMRKKNSSQLSVKTKVMNPPSASRSRMGVASTMGGMVGSCATSRPKVTAHLTPSPI